MGKGDVEYQQHLWHQLQARGLYFIPQTFLLRKMDQPESRGSCTQMEWMVYIKQVNTGSARGELWWMLTSCPDTRFGTKAFISPAGRSVSYWWLMANPSWRITLRWKELLLQRLCPIQRGSPYPVIGQGGDTKIQSFALNLGQLCRTIPAPKLLRDVQMPFWQFHHSLPSIAHSCFSSSSQFLFLRPLYNKLPVYKFLSWKIWCKRVSY